MIENTFAGECYTSEELAKLGLGGFGDHVIIDRSVRLYQPSNLYVGSNVRIDAFCVISASKEGVHIGNYVHLSVGVSLLGNARIDIEDFCGLSARVCVFSSNDDYSGGWLANPTIPDEFRNVKTSPVRLHRHALIGSGSVILPGVKIGIGASVGALSLVNKPVPDFMIVSGNPIRKIGFRDKSLLEKEDHFLASLPKSDS